MKQIIIRIQPDGTILAETKNMKGHECQKYLSELELLAESVSVDSKYKEEFFLDDLAKIDYNNDINEEKIIRNKMKL